MTPGKMIKLPRRWRTLGMGAIFASVALPMVASAQTGATKVLGLQGAPNFRDLGGYATTDGRHVRTGLVFRSNALSALTQADEARIDQLHIVAEIDLRTVQERQQEPDRWLHKPFDIYESPKPSLAPILRQLMPGVKDAATARHALQTFYAGMPDAYRTEFASLFRSLAAGREPLLIHCTAGKDRTGVAAAILLSALGVPRQTVVADYKLTEKLLPPPDASATTSAGSAAIAKSQAATALSRLPADAKAELWRSEDSFILAALRSIDSEYGSVDGYLRTGLGLSAAEIIHIRALLTK